MKLGEKVRYFRKTRNLSQKELAEGICSVSYLSKIENGSTEPSEDIGICLGNRLDINLYNNSYSNSYEEYQNLFFHLYKRNRHAANSAFKKLLGISKENTEDSIFFKIFKSLYTLLTSQDTKESATLLKEVSYLEDGINGVKSFYYFIAKGLLEYYQKNFKNSYLSFKRAEEYIEYHQVKSWEKAYLYYLVALAANRLWKNSICLDYSKMALNIFEDSYEFKRCADCRILLGIVYQRFENWSESTKHFEMAEAVANAFDDNFLRGAIYQNLGYNESQNAKSEEAVKLYTKSLVCKENQPAAFKATTIFTLIKEYLKLGQNERCREQILQGIELVKGDPALYEYQLHFQHYLNILEFGKYDWETCTYLIENVIPYMEKINERAYQVEYLQLVGEYYELQNKYKQASTYFVKTINILKKI
jgi:HTH-type transcriptional regulator, quorum sensing regulator NprR